jgi:hypothetical protein
MSFTNVKTSWNASGESPTANFHRFPRAIFAIDPGKKGAIAWTLLQPDKSFPIGLTLMPSEPADLCEFFNHLCRQNPAPMETIAYLEQVGGYIKGQPQPGSSMFKFGEGFGWIKGVLAAYQIPFIRIRPQTWQKSFSAIRRPGEDKTAHKRRLKAIAAERYPHLAPQITLLTADSLLLLDYALAREHIRFGN